MSYVRLKHALSAIALEAITHPGRAPAVRALRAYARRAVARPRVLLASLARDTGMAPSQVAAVLAATGLFENSTGEDPSPTAGASRGAGRGTITLAAAFRPLLAYLHRQSARSAAALRLLRAPHRAAIPEEIWRATALFNAGLFFECHEYLEDIWRSSPQAEKAFYHGLVQAAAGCYHFEKGNVHGARTLLGKAVAKLEPYAPTHRDVDVARFIGGLRRTLDRLDEADRNEPRHPGHSGTARAALPALDLV